MAFKMFEDIGNPGAYSREGTMKYAIVVVEIIYARMGSSFAREDTSKENLELLYRGNAKRR